MAKELTEAEWLHDLRTTTVPQTTAGRLRDDSGLEPGFCCLGRACELDERATHTGGSSYALARNLDAWINCIYMTINSPYRDAGQFLSWMSGRQAELCTVANDEEKMTFSEIADWWEAGQPVDETGAPVRVPVKE